MDGRAIAYSARDDWSFMGAIGYNAKLSANVISVFQTTVKN